MSTTMYRSLLGTKKETDSFEKYFRFERDRKGVITAVMQKNDVIEKEKKLILTALVITPSTINHKAKVISDGLASANEIAV